MLFSILFSEPLLFAALILGIIFALTVHEYAHALVANALGDPTAERSGRLTLNPLRHLDPVGFLMLLVAGFGYARPVPYNPSYLRDRRMGPVLIALAGPGANILFAMIAALTLKTVSPIIGSENLLVPFLYLVTFINVNLAVFNLIPIPPLDGSKLLFALLTEPRWHRLRYTLETQGPFILIIAILADHFLGIGIFSGVLQFVGNGFFALMGLPEGF
ncbi:MAG: hypothetical protein RL141_77 [Candidatus Parcubacteria bacterium]|jgi:Zn-dependent protease